MAQNREVLFESLPVPKAVARLAIPTVAACLVMVLYNLADTFFVGKLNNSVETSAVTLVAPLMLAFNAVTNLFGTGCSSKMSRALGVRDYETVRKSSALGIYGALICGILFSFCSIAFKKPLLSLLSATPKNINSTASYMFWTVTCGAVPAMLNVVMANLVRAEGGALHASIGTMSGCVLNIILDPFFIFRRFLDMGAAGAGLATFVSNCVACGYFAVYLAVKKKSTYVSINPKDFIPKKAIVTDVFGVGIPASIQNLLNVTGMTIMNAFMANVDKEAVSAMGITHKIAMVPMYVSMGISQGIMPLVGYNYSSGNKKRMKETIRFTELIAGIFIIAATVLMYTNAGSIIKLFMKNSAVIAYGSRFLKGAVIALPFLFVDFLAVGIFQSCGMGKESLIFAVLRKVLLEIPAMFLLNKIYPVYGLAYAQAAAEFILAIAGTVMLEKILKSKKQGALK